MQAAPGRESAFRHLISEHLGTDALSCPVVGRTFQGIEHVNVQGALEQYVAGQGRSWGLLGVTAQNERFMQNALYDLLAAERGAAMSQVGPVEYTELPSGSGEITALSRMVAGPRRQRYRAHGRLRPNRAASGGELRPAYPAQTVLSGASDRPGTAGPEERAEIARALLRGFQQLVRHGAAIVRALDGAEHAERGG